MTTTQTAKHTPGPWHCTARIAGEDMPIYDECADRIAVIRGRDVPHSIATANAHLIASAPDMLEALRRIAYEPQGDAEATHGQILDAVVNIAIAAIAKAEGGAA